MPNKLYTDFLYAKLQRKGALYRDCQRMGEPEPQRLRRLQVACGDADAVITGTTRSYAGRPFDEYQPGFSRRSRTSRVFGLTHACCPRQDSVIADTRPSRAIFLPESEGARPTLPVQTAARHVDGAGAARCPAPLFSNFGNPSASGRSACATAVALLDQRHVDFE